MSQKQAKIKELEERIAKLELYLKDLDSFAIRINDSNLKLVEEVENLKGSNTLHLNKRKSSAST